ncbi:SRPBCC family protein [Streptomyces sp. B-S-A8]|uniref:SRPBCC family protein n=1 Tax=Streptomyces solicavernae TaxID=3043614 RepID=A0ABT6RWJ6_9ACTN|nr:SRPBCC family protein [Streptomyces sp. B-S-A8]MDI3388820.1 SRPBCC family protein [Streptomyces sp. B-S-A8]
MPEFRIARRCPLPPAEAWRRVTDWPRHAAQVPLTRTTVLTPPPAGHGTRFVARTGAGRFAFDDPMEVTEWHPPGPGAEFGRCRLVKTGTFLTGWAEIEVRPLGTGSSVVWREDLRVRRLPRFLDALTARTGRVVFGYALRKVLA